MLHALRSTLKTWLSLIVVDLACHGILFLPRELVKKTFLVYIIRLISYSTTWLESLTSDHRTYIPLVRYIDQNGQSGGQLQVATFNRANFVLMHQGNKVQVVCIQWSELHSLYSLCELPRLFFESLLELTTEYCRF